MSISFNSSLLSRELVISRYNEDLNWTKYIDCFNTIKIYNKGNDIEYPYLQLENINREAHTWFYHIVTNYYNLADITVFSQGNPFDHMIGSIHDKKQRQPGDVITAENINDKLNAVQIPDTGYTPLLHYLDAGEFSAGDTTISSLLYTVLFEGLESEPIIVPGAQFIVMKENIQSKSYDFYKNNLDRLSINRYAWNDTVFNPWSYESMWHYIFNKNILEK